MEARGRNNNFPNGGNLTHGTGNMFNAGTGGSAHEVGGDITPPAPITSLVQVTGGAGQHSSQSAPPAFAELLRDQHVSLLNGGRLVVELRIESHPAPIEDVVASTDSGSSADNNSGPGTGNDSSDGPRCRCGRKRKTPESGSASVNLNRNENATPADDEDGECECQIPPVQGNSSGSISPHDASSSNGHANQPSQASPEGAIEISGAVSSQGNPNMANRDVNSNRSGRSRRRGIPQRSVISGNSSGETPAYQPPPIPVRQGLISVGEQVPFRIRDYVARRTNQQSAFNSSTSQLALGGHGLGSRVDPPPLPSLSYVSASLSDRQAGTLRQTSGDPNPQQGNLSTRNVTDHPLPQSGGVLEQLFYGPNGIMTRNANRGPGGGGGHNVGLRSGVNRRDPRLNSEPTSNPPIGNVQQVATSANPERRFAPPFPSIADQYFADFLAGDREAAQRLHRHTVRRVLNLLQGRHIFAQGNQVLNENNEELDGMRLDIDRMTYEDLLALEERIGDVNTGLSEEVILQRLKPRKHRIYKHKAPEAPETCCICLDEFENRQELGKLDCGHNFHFDCIKQWLMQKNFCPICKTTALPPPKEEA